MRILAFPGVSASTVFSLAALLRAARHAGHEVMIATNPEVAEAAAGIGIPSTVVTTMTWQEAVFRGRDGSALEPPEDVHGRREYVGHMFGRFAASTLAGIGDLVRSWRPTVTLGCPLAFSAPVLAAELGIPCVRQSWDAGDPAREEEVGADVELAPELGRLGLHKVPDPDLRVEIAPPSLLSTDLPPGVPMRWTPGNVQKPLEPWMYRPADRPRVLVTTGSMASPEHRGDVLHRMVEAVVAMEAEVVVATTPELATQLHDEERGIYAGWVPLDVVAPTCDVIVHPVGAVTGMTAMQAGVPQVYVPEWDILLGTTRALEAYGAGVMLPPREGTPEQMIEACRTVLGDVSYRERAGELAREMAELPPPSQIVTEIERLAG